MRTEHLYAGDSGAIERAVALLRDGKLVVFPTDTLYGVGALAYNETAVAALYHIKNRSLDKGIPILLADSEDVHRVARDIPARAQELLDRFWPGPLTLVVPRSPQLPPNISPNANVAVRVPNDEVARAIIRAAGGALATTSANLSGSPPARTAGEALQALEGRVAAVVDAGAAPHGVASTVVDCTVNPPRILRQGALSSELLNLQTA